MNLFYCSSCLKKTPLVQKSETLYGDIEHEYNECQKCGHKSTLSYSDQSIRALRLKIKMLPFGSKKKKELLKKLSKDTEQLRKKVEGDCK